MTTKTEYESILDLWSDCHKDAVGFRPRCKPPATVEAVKEEIASLSAYMAVEQEYEREEEEFQERWAASEARWAEFTSG